ncbi:MAG: TonB-dependent receptor [Tannerellaceae bacterium]|jgi:TonB-linked SusC/RagA family outer membrane protein|nr:TonB-dependent receptor [Tannerellaceae bacterium]
MNNEVSFLLIFFRTTHLVKQITLWILAIVLSTTFSLAQNIIVRGTVTDQTGEPIIGANVSVVGTVNGMITNLEGTYVIQNVPDNASLRFSYVGYITQEVQVNGRTTINVVMNEEVLLLEETVVIGYGSVKKADLTGAVSVVKPDEFKNKSNVSIGDVLQGTAAGVTVRSTGEIGSTPDIKIRGVANLTNNDPLYVIDGMPTSNDVHFNVNDIESIQILKDASAAAIYGSRAANGVIIVTTKRGQEGKTRYNFSSQIAIQNLPRLNYARADQWKKYYDDAADNAIADGIEGVSRMDHWNNDTDWQEEFFKTGVSQNYDFSFSGGTKNGTYRTSFNYLDDTGTTLARHMSRLTVRLNSSAKLGIFNVGESVQLGTTTIKNTGGNVFQIVRMIPTIPVYDDSEFATTDGYGRGSLGNARALGQNPIANANNGLSKNEVIYVRGTAFAEAMIFTWLKYRLNLGMDIRDRQNNIWRTGYATAMNNSDGPSSATNSGNRTIDYLVENTLSFTKRLGKHNIDAVMGTTYQQTISNDYSASQQNLVRASGSFLTTVSAGTSNPSASGTLNEAALISYLGRINYDYDGKYLLSLTARRDGTSRFGKDFRWGTFPSASIGWRISREEFFNVGWIDDLKLRANWGNLGSQNVGYYDYQSYVNSYPQYLFNNSTPTQGQIVAQLANADLSWETLEQKNFGVDMGFLRNRLQVTAEYYISTSHDVLTPLPILMTTGNAGGNPYVNAASIENKGFELTATWRERVNKDFNYSVSANVSHSDNKLLEFGYGKTEQYTTHAVTRVGEPIGMFYLIKTDGLFQSEQEVLDHKNSKGQVIQPNAKPGDIRYIDANDDGTITTGDQVICGSPWPDIEVGLNISATYLNWEFALAGYGNLGVQIYNDTRRYMQSFNDCNSAPVNYDYWTPTNKNSVNPRPLYGDMRNCFDYIDRWLEDGSFFRFNTISVAYNWKQPAFSKGIVDNIRVGVTAQNLLTITKYSSYDPDFRGSLFEPGVDYSSYPSPRSFIFSLNLTF